MNSVSNTKSISVSTSGYIPLTALNRHPTRDSHGDFFCEIKRYGVSLVTTLHLDFSRFTEFHELSESHSGENSNKSRSLIGKNLNERDSQQK